MISNLHPNHTYTCVRQNDTEYHPEILGKTEKSLQNATLLHRKKLLSLKKLHNIKRAERKSFDNLSALFVISLLIVS